MKSCMIEPFFLLKEEDHQTRAESRAPDGPGFNYRILQLPAMYDPTPLSSSEEIKTWRPS